MICWKLFEKVSHALQKFSQKESFVKTSMHLTEPGFRARLCFLYLSATDLVVLSKAFRGRRPKCSTKLDLPVDTFGGRKFAIRTTKMTNFKP